MIFSNLQSVISRTFFPYLSRRSDKHSVFMKINIAVSVFGAVLLFLLAPLIIKIMLGDDFNESDIVLRILSLSIIFLALNDTFGTNFLIINHHEQELRNITIIASIIGFFIAFPLVKYYSYVGAAITIFASRFVLGVLTFIQYKRLK